MSEYFELAFPETEKMEESNASLVSLLADQEESKNDVPGVDDSMTDVLHGSICGKNSSSSPLHTDLDLFEKSAVPPADTLSVQNEPAQSQVQKSDLMSTDVNMWSSNVPNTIEEGDDQAKQMFEKLQTCEKISMQAFESPKQGGDLKEQELKSVLLCRLCAGSCQGSAPIFLFQHPPHHPEVLPKTAPDEHEEEMVGDILSMIKATLPIKVSCCDKLPKQVCKMCVERLRLSYAFTNTVLKAESQLQSLRTNKSTDLFNDAKLSFNSISPYNCPVCKETPPFPNQSGLQPSFIGFQGERYAWDGIAIKDEPEEAIEPSHEELEKSYYDMFGGQKDDFFRTEERITLKPSKPTNFGGRRPRGRPRTRQPKVIPRGRRGRRSTQTTVEKLLELSRNSVENEGYGFRICSRENNPATEALTQCLLCERWFPGAAACLQHSLADHLDCGAFLCPRCQRDDFPGDFELIQHYQEVHCPDLELYEVHQEDRSEMSNFGYINQTEPEGKLMKPQGQDSVCVKEEEEGVLKSSGMSEIQNSSWPTETMDYESMNNNMPSNEFYESQDELSSNISEQAPRSLTSHSALCEEESNSISTHGSDSNLALEDTLAHHTSEQQAVSDKVEPQSSILTQEETLSGSACTIRAGDFSVNLSAMEEESQEHSKLLEDTVVNSNGDQEIGNCQNSHFKVIHEDCQSQDSLRAEELCGFQEAISETSHEVSLNGNAIHFDSDPS